MAKQKSVSQQTGIANRAVNKGKQKMVAEIPARVNDPSKDKLVYGAFAGVLLLGLSINLALLYFIGANLYANVTSVPPNWLVTGVMALLFGLVLFFGLRPAINAPFFIAATVGDRVNALEAQRKICEWALKYRGLLPDRASWASQAILQQLMMAEKHDEIIAMGTSTYEELTTRNANENSLAPLCGFVGMAYQAKNEVAKAIEWHEKALEQYERSFKALEKSKMAKKLTDQSVVQTLNLNYAGTFCTLAGGYMQQQNFRKAKELFKKSLEQARKCPESSQRRDLIKAVEDQLSRLKHW
jgi:tetratricopeptide (TPR) repeat protein